MPHRWRIKSKMYFKKLYNSFNKTNSIFSLTKRGDIMLAVGRLSEFKYPYKIFFLKGMLVHAKTKILSFSAVSLLLSLQSCNHSLLKKTDDLKTWSPLISKHISLVSPSELDFITRNCEFISHNSEKKSQNCELSCNSVFISLDCKFISCYSDVITHNCEFI